MTHTGASLLRTARTEDGPQLLRLWTLLFDDDGTAAEEPWKGHARNSASPSPPRPA